MKLLTKLFKAEHSVHHNKIINQQNVSNENIIDYPDYSYLKNKNLSLHDFDMMDRANNPEIIDKNEIKIKNNEDRLNITSYGFMKSKIKINNINSDNKLTSMMDINRKEICDMGVNGSSDKKTNKKTDEKKDKNNRNDTPKINKNPDMIKMNKDNRYSVISDTFLNNVRKQPFNNNNEIFSTFRKYEKIPDYEKNKVDNLIKNLELEDDNNESKEKDNKDINVINNIKDIIDNRIIKDINKTNDSFFKHKPNDSFFTTSIGMGFRKSNKSLKDNLNIVNSLKCIKKFIINYINYID